MGSNALWSLAILAMLSGCSGSVPAGSDESDESTTGGDEGSSATTTTGAGGSSDVGAGTGTGTTGSGTGTGGGSTAPCPHPDFAAKFEQVRASLESALQSNGVPGGSLAIVCGGEILSAGVGVVKNGGAPVTGSTRFQLASLTKMLTATAALALAENGTITVDAPVGQIMPQLAYGDAVTMGHLLSHSSGLPVDFPSYYSDELIQFALDNKNMQPSSSPGTKWEYNNNAYAVIGALLETASGKPYDALVQDDVLGPIGMTGATMHVSDVLAEGDYAWGHNGSTELGPEDSYYGSKTYGPMGGAWAGAEDLAKYARSLLGNGPLAERLKVQMIPRIATGEYPGVNYGYGLFIDDYEPTLVYHGGSVEGFLSDMEVVPEAGIAAIVLVNSDSYYPGDITFQALEAFVQL